jgi:hypothetical protein
MQPEAPAVLARTGLVVVTCWVLNAPVLLTIRVLGMCGPCCVVPPRRLPSCEPPAYSDCRMPPARRCRRQPSRERSISFCAHPPLGPFASGLVQSRPVPAMRALSFPCPCLVILSCSPAPRAGSVVCVCTFWRMLPVPALSEPSSDSVSEPSI